MGLNTFSTALSGMDSSTMGLNVVGNNLANLNTVGFKGSDVLFSEVLGQQFSTPGGNVNHIGLGSQVQAIRTSSSQGGIQSSNNPLDVAIQGQGMLVVSDNGTRMYTRAGSMRLGRGRKSVVTERPQHAGIHNRSNNWRDRPQSWNSEYSDSKHTDRSDSHDSI
jgi:flagellar hook-basal body protein